MQIEINLRTYYKDVDIESLIETLFFYQVTDIRALQYTASGEIFYKLRFSEEYKLLQQRRNARINKTPLENIPILYTDRRKITKKKFLDLQQLKNAMPRDYQNYYDNLPHED